MYIHLTFITVCKERNFTIPNQSKTEITIDALGTLNLCVVITDQSC